MSKYSCSSPNSLRLFDAVDAEIGFEIGVEFDHFRRITRLLDNEVDQKRFQLATSRRLSSSARGRSAETTGAAAIAGSATGTVDSATADSATAASATALVLGASAKKFMT